MIGTRRPGVDLDTVSQCDDQELYFLVLDNLEMNRALEVSDVDPAVALLHVRVADTFRSKDLGLEPREIVDADAVLFARNRHQNVLTLEHLHLLEPTPRYQLIHFTLSAPIQQHQPVLRADEQIDSYNLNKNKGKRKKK